MCNRALWVLLLALPASLGAELIKTSLLKERQQAISLSRNLFLPSGPAVRSQNPEQQAEMTPEVKKTLAEEISQSVKYVGKTVKDGSMTAILNVSGEYHFVKENDLILERIKIVKITPDTVTIEYENQRFEIKLDKGNENVQVQDIDK